MIPHGGSAALILIVLMSMTYLGRAASREGFSSHPPLQPLATPSNRPMGSGPALFVDAARGDDANDGSQAAPFRTVQHAAGRLKPGDTLVLRGGIYYEQFRLSLQGRDNAPITIRSYPGELAILDGGIRAFYEKPADAWEPVPDGATGEYRSTTAYANVRDVLGAFGDSMVGLVNYWHAQDLRSDQNLWDQPKGEEVKPIYGGPGIWYNPQTSRIHIRLAHTHLDAIGDRNYRGETDPRKLPLVIAPFRSVPLWLDDAQHVLLQDLIIRGGGYDTIRMTQGQGITFDGVTVHCGTYGVRTQGVRGLRFIGSALHGGVPAWHFRTENRYRSRPSEGHRDIARLMAHALWVDDGYREFEVFAAPASSDWEIAYSAFTDGHDGLYLGGIDGVRFHHNLIENFHDDGLYLSPMSAYRQGQVHVYQNLFRGCLTALAFGGVDPTRDVIWIYRNVFDLRLPVNYDRPTVTDPRGNLSNGWLMGKHGSPTWPTMNIYHNTCIAGGQARTSPMGLFDLIDPEHPRQVLNNIFLHMREMPATEGSGPTDRLTAAGNLFAQHEGEVKKPAASEPYGLVAPAKLSKLVSDPRDPANDYRLQPDSPAVNAGTAIPADWPDPIRDADQAEPDIGALPIDAEPLKVGPAAAER